jgi:hypothetical protein
MLSPRPSVVSSFVLISVITSIETLLEFEEIALLIMILV